MPPPPPTGTTRPRDNGNSSSTSAVTNGNVVPAHVYRNDKVGVGKATGGQQQQPQQCGKGIGRRSSAAAPSYAPLAPFPVSTLNAMERNVFRIAKALLGGHQGNGFARSAANIMKLKQQRIRQVESKEREARKNGIYVEEKLPLPELPPEALAPLPGAKPREVRSEGVRRQLRGLAYGDAQSPANTLSFHAPRYRRLRSRTGSSTLIP